MIEENMEIQMNEKKDTDIRYAETKTRKTEIQEDESELEYESEEFEIEVQYDNPTTNTDISGNDKIYMHSYNDEQLEQLEDKLESELDEIDQEDQQHKTQDQYSENNEVYSEDYENDQLEDSIEAEHSEYTKDERQIEKSEESKSNDDQKINIIYDKDFNSDNNNASGSGSGSDSDSDSDNDKAYGQEDIKEDDKEDDREDGKEDDKEDGKEDDKEDGKEDDKEDDREDDREDGKEDDKTYRRGIDNNKKETKNGNDYLIEELWESDLDDDYEDDNKNDLPLSHIPVYIDLGADVFKLFQPNCKEDEDFQDLGTLFPSSTILLSPLSALFEDLRKFMNDGETDKRGELELKIKDLDNLTVNEDSVCCKDLSMNHLLMMYESLRENSENKDLHKFVQVELHRKWGIIDRIREIEIAINRGGSLDSLSRVLKRGHDSYDDYDDESKIKRTKI